MAISFEKHRQKIIAAWKDVLDDKSTTDWSLFGYEGQTNELQVISSGEGGLEELSEDLNSAKIMYAFVRLDDPKTSLTKFLLINWQGEGAPILRKGTCANHIIDVQKLLTGAHLTINARIEDDIDKDRILKQLITVGAGANRFNKDSRSPHHIDEPKAPVGTNYNRVIPAKELNPTEMQNFWKKEEEEERHRIELEKERKRLELLKREEELRAREEKEFLEREKQIDKTNKLQPAHVPIKTSPQPLSPEKIISSPTRVMTEAEKMRQQRSQEARELIGSRVGTAKAIFSQNNRDGQIQSKNVAPVKPVRNSIAQRITALNNSQQQQQQQQQQQTQQHQQQQQEHQQQTSNKVETVIHNATSSPSPIKEAPVTPEVRIKANDDGQQNVDDFIETEEQYSTIKRSPHSKTNSIASPDEGNVTFETNTKTIDNNISSQEANNNINMIVKNGQNDVASEEDMIYQHILSDDGLKARALYDYQAADESEISFDPGDIITHIDQIDEGWWQGLGPDGTYGLFPANYVELIN